MSAYIIDSAGNNHPLEIIAKRKRSAFDSFKRSRQFDFGYSVAVGKRTPSYYTHTLRNGHAANHVLFLKCRSSDLNNRIAAEIRRNHRIMFLKIVLSEMPDYRRFSEADGVFIHAFCSYIIFHILLLPFCDSRNCGSFSDI